MLDHWSDSLIRKFELMISPIGLLLNIVLLILIIKCTPETLKTYRVMIELMTISDIVMTVTLIMLTARTFPTSNQLFLMFRGFCELFSENLESRAKFCMMCYAQKMTSYMLNHMILVVSYVYRLLLITKPFDNFNRRNVYLACYSYTLVHFSYFNWVGYMVLEPMDKVNAEVAKVRPELIGSNWTYFAVIELFSPSQIGMTVISVMFPWVVLIISVICCIRIKQYLARFQFSAASKELHKSVLNVLLTQTLGPLMSAVTSSMYFVVRESHESVLPSLENIMQIPLGTTIIVNPIVTVSLVVPYRKAVLKFMGLEKSAIIPVVSSTTSTANSVDNWDFGGISPVAIFPFFCFPILFPNSIPMLDHWSDSLIRKYELMISPIGLLFNIVLLILIIKRTPETLKTYTVMIRLMTISDIVMASTLIMLTARTFPTGNQVFFMFRGVCELFSENLESRAKFCMTCYTQKITSYILNHMILVISYFYRLLLITKPFDNFNRKTIHLACYGYAVVHFTYFNWVGYMVLEPMDKVNAEVAKVRPELIGSNWTYFAVIESYSPSQIGMTVASVMSPWIVLIISVICCLRIKQYLARFQFSAASKELHKSVLNVLLTQTLGPLMSAVTISIYIVVSESHESVLPLLENIMQLPLGTTIILNPIVTVSFVSPYRNAILKFMRVQKSETIPATLIVSHNLV